MTPVDNIPPVITNCPQSVTYTIALGMASRVVTWNEPIATDNSGQQPDVIQTHLPGESFNLGSTEVCYIFSDAANNQDSCCFTITGK